MAITECSECKGTVSTKAVVCPHCGAPVARENTLTDSPPINVVEVKRQTGAAAMPRLNDKFLA